MVKLMPGSQAMLCPKTWASYLYIHTTADQEGSFIILQVNDWLKELLLPDLVLFVSAELSRRDKSIESDSGFRSRSYGKK